MTKSLNKKQEPAPHLTREQQISVALEACRPAQKDRRRCIAEIEALIDRLEAARNPMFALSYPLFLPTAESVAEAAECYAELVRPPRAKEDRIPSFIAVEGVSKIFSRWRGREPSNSELSKLGKAFCPGYKSLRRQIRHLKGGVRKPKK
jgi:hypothetical protein